MRDREAVARLAADIQHATGDVVDLAYVDQGCTGHAAANAAADEGIILDVVKLPEARRGFVRVPRHWVVEGLSPGLRVADVLSRITKVMPKTWPGFILSRSWNTCLNKRRP